jgi:peptidyl-dipeptidase Dcp
MKKIVTGLMIAGAIMTQTQVTHAENVFDKPFSDTVHGTAPFSKISNKDYEPAIDRGITLAQQEIDAIVNNPEAPTFANTIEALERVGADLNRVLNVFYPLLSADADDEMMEISMRISPKLSNYSTSVTLNDGLW